MVIRVDFDVCEANAVCCGLAPEVFELDDDENLIVKIPEPTGDQLARVEKAVARCPRAALSLS